VHPSSGSSSLIQQLYAIRSTVLGRITVHASSGSNSLIQQLYASRSTVLGTAEDLIFRPAFIKPQNEIQAI
jgi:hypothetical protein